MQSPDDCQSMADLRQLIDRIDRDLVTALAVRQACIDRAVILKQSEHLPARIPDRVEAVVHKVRSHAEATGLDADLAERLWRDIIEWAIAREEGKMRETDGGA